MLGAKLKSLVHSVFGNEVRKIEAPPPDVADQPRYIRETVQKVLFSTSKNYRAVITLDRYKQYRVHQEHWCISELEYIGKAFWEPSDHFATITDTMERARALAKESLRESGDGYTE